MSFVSVSVCDTNAPVLAWRPEGSGVLASVPPSGTDKFAIHGQCGLSDLHHFVSLLLYALLEDTPRQ